MTPSSWSGSAREEILMTQNRDPYERIQDLEIRVERLEKPHCKDCCCAQSWEALGVKEYDGGSIPEHINSLQAENEELWELLTGVVKECGDHGWDSAYRVLQRCRNVLKKRDNVKG
jgi:hypothetical protein